MAAAVPEHEPELDVLHWPDFQRLFFLKHRAGEHVAIVGPTGAGKSVLGLGLCKLLAKRKTSDGRPASVLVLATKPRDKTVSALGWPVLKSWPPSYGQEHAIVWPRGGKASGIAERQRRVFGPLLDEIYQEGGHTVYIDEAAYFERPLPSGLGLAPTLEQFWTSARALGVTLVAGTQRPRLVSRSMWSEPSWLFIFPPEDLDDLKRVAELSGRRLDVLAIADRLGSFEFLVVRRQRNGARALYVSRVES